MKGLGFLVLGLLVICTGSKASPLSEAKPVVEHVVFPPNINIGGLGPIEPPTENVQKMVQGLYKEIKVEACKALGLKAGEGECAPDHKITALGYKAQVVAGTNYFVSILSDTGHVWHLRIYEHLNGKQSLEAISGPKKKEDDIVYFEKPN